jgi:hypothetical protein
MRKVSILKRHAALAPFYGVKKRKSMRFRRAFPAAQQEAVCRKE